MRRLGSAVIAFAIVGAIFYYALAETGSRTRKHPYDGIVDKRVSPPFRAQSKNRILRDVALRAPLQLSAAQVQDLTDLYASYESQHKSFYDRWRSDHPEAPYYVPLSAVGASEFELAIYEQAVARLNDSQRKQLFVAEYRLSDWGFVYFSEVRNEFKLTDVQIMQFKQAHLEFVSLRNEWNRRWRDSDPDAQPGVAEQGRRAMAEFRFRFDEILTADQREQRDAWFAVSTSDETQPD